MPRHERGGRRLAWALLTPVLGLLGFLFVLPVVMTVIRSFQDATLLTLDDASFVGLDNYRRLVTDSVFLDSLWLTIVWSTVTTGLSLTIGMGVALALNEGFRGRNVLRGIALAPWAIPPVAVGLLFIFIYNPEVGLINDALKFVGLTDGRTVWFGDVGRAFPSVVLMATWRQVPFFILTLLAGLQGVPADLMEAARIDGANGLQRFIYITLPHMRGVITISVALMVIWNFNNFDLIWATTQGGPANATNILPVMIYRQVFDSLDMSYAATIGVGWLVTLVVFAVFYLRQMERD